MVRSIPSLWCLLLTVMMGCGCGQTSFQRDPIPHPVPAHLPFVESVTFPSSITAGIPFEVRLLLSASAKPEILGAGIGTVGTGVTTSVTSPIALDTLLSPSSLDVLASPYFAVLDSYGPPASEFTVQFPALTAGEHQVYVLSTDSPESGGLLLDDLIGGSYPSDNLPPGVAYQTYTITVQPAP